MSEASVNPVRKSVSIADIANVKKASGKTETVKAPALNCFVKMYQEEKTGYIHLIMDGSKVNVNDGVDRKGNPKENRSLFVRGAVEINGVGIRTQGNLMLF